MRYISFMSVLLLSAAGLHADPARDLAREVAEASGLARWPQVRKIQFTFNVQLPDKQVQRSWSWSPKTGEVVQHGPDGPLLSWKRADLATASEEVKKADAAFINDSYWLLFPFRVVWDSGTTLTLGEVDTAAPLGVAAEKKLTVTYTGVDGYTPGDAYDLFIGVDRRIAAWIFRKGNAAVPTRLSTWEDYREIGGLQIAHEHKGPEGFRVWFTGVSVE
jgi:hypothetical protein